MSRYIDALLVVALTIGIAALAVLMLCVWSMYKMWKANRKVS